MVFTPGVGEINTGNSRTADQWTEILRSLGHDVTSCDACNNFSKVECLVALHANKSREITAAFSKQYPDRMLILALTGTDIYPKPDREAIEAMKSARFLIVLQNLAMDQIPVEFRNKTHVVIQSVRRSQMKNADARSKDPFLISVIGHLRDVKDPLRAAKAARRLPESSKIQIRQLGAVLESKYYKLIALENAENDRFQYLDEQPETQVREIIRQSQATVVSSFNEGGARVIGESIVEGTPLIATRIPGVVGLTGANYPALFPPGNTSALTSLLIKLEQDRRFREKLNLETDRLAPKFDPAREREAWRRLVG